MATRVTIWNEFRHEKKKPEVMKIYPEGMHQTIAKALKELQPDLKIKTATLDEADHGLGGNVLTETDVLVWWGHVAHDEVSDKTVDAVQQSVLAGMGLVVLHSGHFSKVFKRLMGTSCDLKWREALNEREVLWVTRPGHPVVKDIDDHFILAEEEMYGEYFDIPEPECTFLISSFGGGEVFRSGCTWTRGAGRIVYFRPGHESFPTYKDANVIKVIRNAINYAVPTPGPAAHSFGNRKMGWIDKK